MTLSTFATLLLVCVVNNAQITVNIVTSRHPTERNVTFSGMDRELFSDEEVVSFGLTDTDEFREKLFVSLKKDHHHFAGNYDIRFPLEVFVKGPLPWAKELIHAQRHLLGYRELHPIKTTIVSSSFKAIPVYYKVYRNPESTNKMVNIKLGLKLQDNITSIWKTREALTIPREIEHVLEKMHLIGKGKSKYTYMSKWGQNSTSSRSVRTDLDSVLTTQLHPKQAVAVQAIALSGSLKVRIEYEGRATGELLVVPLASTKLAYFSAFEEYRYAMAPTGWLAQYLEGAGLNKTIPSTESIEFNYYLGVVYNITDVKSNLTLYSIGTDIY